MCNKCGGKTPSVGDFINTRKIQQNYYNNASITTQIVGGVSTLIGKILAGIDSSSPEEESQVPVKPKREEVPVEEDEVKEYTDEEIKKDIETRLKSKKITNIDNSTLEELVERYKQIKSENPNYDDNLLTLRLENFVRGKVNHQKTATWTKLEKNYLSTEEGLVSDAQPRANLLGNTTPQTEIIDLEKENEISIEKLRALSMQVLEFVDSNGDRAIDLVEYYRNNLISYYQTFEELEINSATQKADEKISELKLKTNQDVINYAQTLNNSTQVGEELTLIDTMLKFDSLNQTEETIEITSSLDIQELMAYHATMANFNTSDNKIDNGDFSLFNNSMTEDIMMTLENGTSVNKREYFLENYYNAIKNFKEN